MNSSAHKVKILGIDPGSLVAGFACIGSLKPDPLMPGDFQIIDAGVIRLNPKQAPDWRIAKLHQTVVELIRELTPTCCIIEKAFFGINVKSALRLGEARGALMSAIHAENIPYFEVAPTAAKKAVTGTGGASKEDVRNAVQALLRCELTGLPLDVSDALALALCHGMNLKSPMLGASGISCEGSVETT